MNTSELITKLDKLILEHGDVKFHVYGSFNKKTLRPSEDDVHFDADQNEIYLGLYF